LTQWNTSFPAAFTSYDLQIRFCKSR